MTTEFSEMNVKRRENALLRAAAGCLICVIAASPQRPRCKSAVLDQVKPEGKHVIHHTQVQKL